MKHPINITGNKAPGIFSKSEAIKAGLEGETSHDLAKKALQKKMHLLMFENKNPSRPKLPINSSNVYTNLDNDDSEHK